MAYDDEKTELLFNVADRLEAIEKIVEGGDESSLLRVIRQGTRERRLLQAETESSQVVSAQAADRLLGIQEGIKELIAEVKVLIDGAKSEILAKERSARTSSNLLQTKQADLEEQMVTIAGQVAELVNLVKSAQGNAARTTDTIDQAETYFRGLLEDGAFRKELRQLAQADRQTADREFVMEVAMLAIRQAIESGLLAPGTGALKPKPERPVD